MQNINKFFKLTNVSFLRLKIIFYKIIDLIAKFFQEIINFIRQKFNIKIFTI